MKSISTVGWYYLIYGLTACGIFSTAAVQKWRSPDFGSGGSSHYSGSSGSHSSGSSYSRGWGGSWGGGK